MRGIRFPQNELRHWLSLERSAPAGLSAAYFFRLQGRIKFDDDACTGLESNQQFDQFCFMAVRTSLQLFCPFSSPKRNNIVAVLLYFCSLMKQACAIIDDRPVIILERE